VNALEVTDDIGPGVGDDGLAFRAGDEVTAALASRGAVPMS
jgi:hypothetical protein